MHIIDMRYSLFIIHYLKCTVKKSNFEEICYIIMEVLYLHFSTVGAKICFLNFLLDIVYRYRFLDTIYFCFLAVSAAVFRKIGRFFACTNLLLAFRVDFYQRPWQTV